jgi:site-specific recombinase XerD
MKRISTKQTTKPLALKFLYEFNQDIANRKKIVHKTLNQFRNEYELTSSNTFSKKYQSIVKSTFYIFCKDIDSNIPLVKITPLITERFFAQTFQRTQHGAWLYYRVLKSAFNKAVNWNYINENPLNKIKLPKPTKKNPAFINEIELIKILSNEANPELRQIYSFAFNTGMRREEILSLQWKAIDFKNELVNVNNSEVFRTKNKTDRTIPMNNKVKEILLSRYPKLIDINRESFVFSKPNGIKFSGDFICKTFKKAVIKSELSNDIHFHSLRHSFASNLVSKGVSIYEVSKLLGHSSVNVTQIYAHLRTEDLRASINLLNN